VNKQGLIDAVADCGEDSKAATGEAIGAVLGTIVRALTAGDSLQLVGFGSFSTGQRAARIGCNPSTGAEMQIAAAMTVKFMAGKSFTDEPPPTGRSDVGSSPVSRTGRRAPATGRRKPGENPPVGLILRRKRRGRSILRAGQSTEQDSRRGIPDGVARGGDDRAGIRAHDSGTESAYWGFVKVDRHARQVPFI
jgi:DNA-binding protein HU-beta